MVQNQSNVRMDDSANYGIFLAHKAISTLSRRTIFLTRTAQASTMRMISNYLLNDFLMEGDRCDAERY